MLLPEKKTSRVLEISSPSKASPSKSRLGENSVRSPYRVHDALAIRKNPLGVLHSSNWVVPDHPTVAPVPTRRIPTQPEKMLDAPDIIDDYYLNILSWGAKNVLAVALRDRVYLWDAVTAETKELMSTDNDTDYVSAVRWNPDGTRVAIGTAHSEVSVWDPERQVAIAQLQGHESRVSCLAWNAAHHPAVLTSGGRDAHVLYHDTRARASSRPMRLGSATGSGHTQEVCGLQWSTTGGCLASGGNDNVLNLWDVRNLEGAPKFRLEHHNAAVKALAWCPWQSEVLASGGGTADRHIRFWNTTSGACLNSIDTKSQVCALQWSSRHREIVSSHGFSHNQLVLWKYPLMKKLAEFTGHTSRVLHLEKSPDGLTVVSAAGDETIRFWRIWDTDEGPVLPGAGMHQLATSSPRKRSRSGISSPMHLR